jgi:hypothetical protein
MGCHGTPGAPVRITVHGTALGCVQAWVLTSPGNDAARGLYAAAGGRAEAEPSLLFEYPRRP